eukprot:scaffold11_cov257-Pinguiococcus_pyrenoidosus.AAC.41
MIIRFCHVYASVQDKHLVEMCFDEELLSKRFWSKSEVFFCRRCNKAQKSAKPCSEEAALSLNTVPTKLLPVSFLNTPVVCARFHRKLSPHPVGP